jgi:NADH:ubiquinone oxidoreductase subunit 4 (subunit M)
LGKVNPKLAGAFTIAALAALGLPGLAGFVGELVILTGVFKNGYFWPALVALIPIVIASAYMLRLLQDIINGPERPDIPHRRDLTWIEGLAVAPLLAALVVLGVYPHAVLSAATTFAAPSGSAQVSSTLRRHEALGAPSLAMAVPNAHPVRNGRLTSYALGGAEFRTERLLK